MSKQESQEIKRPSDIEGVIFLLYKNGQILIEERVKEGSGYYGHIRIPGGEIEKGETPREAAIREIREELDVKATKLFYLDSFEDVTLNGGYHRFHAFLVTEWEGQVQGLEPEKSEIHWIDYSIRGNMLKLASSRLILCEAHRVLNGLGFVL